MGATHNQQSEAAAVAEIVYSNYKPTVVEVTDPKDGTVAQYIAVPSGTGGMSLQCTERDLDSIREIPLHRTGHAQFTRLDSLIAHVNRFKNTETALFACDDVANNNAAILAVIDYHDRVNSENGDVLTDAKPRRRNHTAKYNFPISDELKAWLDANDNPMGQQEFAEFLEDRITDVMPVPAFLKDGTKAKAESNSDKELLDILVKIQGRPCGPEKLMELSRGLSITSHEDVKGIVNIASGEATIAFEETHMDEKGQKITVPNMFLIAIPVFKMGAPYRIPVRLRYRKSGPRIVWSLHVYSLEQVLDHAVNEACTHASTATGCPLYFGKPE